MPQAKRNPFSQFGPILTKSYWQRFFLWRKFIQRVFPMLLLFAIPALGQDYFRIVSLGNLQPQIVPGAFREYRMNSIGQVVGKLSNQAAIWQSGTITLLGFFPGATTSGNPYSYGVAINNTGWVAGLVDDLNGDAFASVHKPSGWFSLLYPSGYHFTLPSAINSFGQIVGYTTTSAFAAPYGEAFYSSKADGNTRPIILYPNGGDGYGIAYGINDNGFIVGDSIRASGNQGWHTAVYWVTNGSGPGVLDNSGQQSSAQAINNNNCVVGYKGPNAFVFAGPSYSLPTGVANAINPNNFIVGNSVQTSTASQSTAWFFSPSSNFGGAYDLTSMVLSSHITLYTASDINANLQIVGQSSAGGYIATPIIYRLVSGNWNSSSSWLWDLQPSSLHPVVIASVDGNTLAVSGPTAPSTISELTIGASFGSPTSGLIISSGQSLTVSSNLWGRGITTVLSSGILLLDGQISSPVTIQGVLAGAGTINGPVIVQSGGFISDGNTLGPLTVNGNVALNSGSSMIVNIAGEDSTPQYNQLKVEGSVVLENAALIVSSTNDISVGRSFMIIDNHSSSAIEGIFKELPEGTIFDSGKAHFQITYKGGDGNDVILMRVSPAILPSVSDLHPLSNRQMQITAVGQEGLRYNVEANSDLITPNWVTIGSVQASPDGGISFIDTNAPDFSGRFYRLKSN